MVCLATRPTGTVRKCRVPNHKWNDDDLAKLSQVKGSAFEVVDTGPIKTSY